MGVLDKFLNAMKLNDDEDLEGEGYLDEDYDDDYEEERPKKRILSSKSEEDEEDGPEEVPQRAERDRKADVGSTSSRQKPRVVKSNPSTQKISQMRPRKGSGMEVCVIKPRSMEDTHEITETLQENCTVVLNMEGIDMDLAQRIIDFSSGSCYALHGGLLKISNYIFIITPKGVDISGDFQEVLTGAIGVPAYEARF